MTQENLEEIKATQLGENVYSPKVEKEIPEVKQQEESCYGKPEKYDYSEVELPENYYYDEEMLNEFNELAGKYNLSQKSANELMAMAVKLTKLTGDNFSKTIADKQRQQIEEFKHNLINDREIGGAAFERTMKTANIAYNQFADEEVQTLLSKTGLNCHPKVVKMFYKIGKLMQNDSIRGNGVGAVHKENREDILFPTM